MIDALLWVFAIIGAGALLFGLVIMLIALAYFYRAYQIQRRMVQLIGAAAAKAGVAPEEETKPDMVN